MSEKSTLITKQEQESTDQDQLGPESVSDSEISVAIEESPSTEKRFHKKHQRLLIGAIAGVAALAIIGSAFIYATLPGVEQTDNAKMEIAGKKISSAKTPLASSGRQETAEDEAALDNAEAVDTADGAKAATANNASEQNAANQSNSTNSGVGNSNNSGSTGGGNTDSHAGQTWHDGWWEQVPQYATDVTPGYYNSTYALRTICNQCGADVSGFAGQHIADNYPNCHSYRDENRQVGQEWIPEVTNTYISGYNSVWHEGYWS